MAGIYIHIPFCRKACHYCNFHFSTQLDSIQLMTDAICKEIKQQEDFLKGEPIDTIYFGGGTPSLLETKLLEQIINQINQTFDCSKIQEFTLEANPEDINKEKLLDWQDLGVNRLSIGVQSFFDEDLKYMNRAHDAKTSISALDLCKSFGPENVSIDLIFGGHTTTNMMWEENLKTFINYEFAHLSAYGLTVEENTALSHFIKKGKLSKPDDDKSSTQFLLCMDLTNESNYDHYEISNYALEGCAAVHNTNYWRGVPYLGVGPSAHSFDGSSRYWSVANNQSYLKSSASGTFEYNKEELCLKDQYNEWVMTGLRHQGCSMSKLETHYHTFEKDFLQGLENQIGKGNVIKKADKIQLSRFGKLISDRVISDFFATE